MDLKPIWLNKAIGEIGVEETPGVKSTARVVEYHKSTAAGAAPDSVPWCSSFVNWVFKICGVEGTRSKAALSWLQWGEKCGPIVGAVGVIRWRPWQRKGHVGFVVGKTPEGRIILCGGNQGDAVSLKSYPRRKFAGFRWPETPIMDDPGTAGTR